MYGKDIQALEGEEWMEPDTWYEVAPRAAVKRLASAEFDAGVNGITEKRGAVYGHPLEDFTKIAALKAALPNYGNPALQHAAEMICVKLARLGQTPGHVDSLIDIAGYARTWSMILDKL